MPLYRTRERRQQNGYTRSAKFVRLATQIYSDQLNVILLRQICSLHSGHCLYALRETYNGGANPFDQLIRQAAGYLRAAFLLHQNRRTLSMRKQWD